MTIDLRTEVTRHLDRAAGYLELIKSETSKRQREADANAALSHLKSARMLLETCSACGRPLSGSKHDKLCGGFVSVPA